MAMRRRRFSRGSTGQREPHLWSRTFFALPNITSAGSLQQANAFSGSTLDTGIDARRTVKRLLVKFSIIVATAALNQIFRVLVHIVKRKIGEAASTPAYNTVASKQADVLWSWTWTWHSPNAAVGQLSLEQLLGHELVADVKAMRKLEVNDELRVEAEMDRAGAVLIAGDLAILGGTASTLVQRTRR